MKALILPVGIIAATALWYSSAQAEPNHHRIQHREQAHQRHQAHDRHNFDRRHDGWNHQADRRHDGRDRHENNGHGWGRDGAGRDFGRSHQSRWSHDGYRYRNAAADRGIDRWQWQQRQRIEQASRAGQLTRDERRSLWGEQRAIAAEERRYLADGRLNRGERRDLQQDLTLASRHIYNESHDRDRR